MLMLRALGLVGLTAVTALAGLQGCSSDAAAPGGKPALASGDAGTGGATSKADAAAPAKDSGPVNRPRDAYNGDCSTARWSNATDECWKCMCDACKPTLDACDDNCVGVFECAITKHTLVNVGSELGCEIRATGALCLQEPNQKAGANAVLAFDGCLLGPAKVAPNFRACDVECQVPYPGDVCTRFPAP